MDLPRKYRGQKTERRPQLELHRVIEGTRAEISRFCTLPAKTSQPLAPGVVTAHGARARVAGEATPCPCHLLLIAVNKGCHGALGFWPVSTSALNSCLHVSTVNLIVTVYLYLSARVSQPARRHAVACTSIIGGPCPCPGMFIYFVATPHAGTVAARYSYQSCKDAA
jgi:hypothetical protein